MAVKALSVIVETGGAALGAETLAGVSTLRVDKPLISA